MFTGIVESTGTIDSITGSGSSLTLAICCPFAKELTLGESVAVNGTCLTVTSRTDSIFTADVTPESFRRTFLGQLDCGSLVNLERAMKADGRFGGHIVSGHVDGTGRLVSAVNEGNAVNITFEVSGDLIKYIIEKGSVCIDGISLTVASVSLNEGTFSIAVIPHTWENTTLHTKKSGATVNIECDIVGKYIERFVQCTEQCKVHSAQGTVNDKDLENLMTGFTSFH